MYVKHIIIKKEIDMFSKLYSIVDEKNWDGRIDSTDDFDSFRWHQWVKKLDLSRDDLKPFEGKLGFAFLGFECDMGIQINKGRSGAANGPESIRTELANLPCQFSKEVALYDAGNIYCCDGSSLNEAQEALATAVDKILDLNLFPILLGGGHEIAFGHYKGIMKNLDKSSEKLDLGIINFDAHFDLRPYDNGPSSGTMFRQIADYTKDNNLNYSYFCIGIQKYSNTVNLFKTAHDLGVEYILARDISHMDTYTMMEKVDEFIKDQDHIYVTICSDVFSSAFAPGVSAPQPLGLDPEKVLVFLNHILKSKKTLSFDIAEVSPRFDLDNNTSNLASIMIFSVVNTLSKVYCKNNDKLYNL